MPILTRRVYQGKKTYNTGKIAPLFFKVHYYYYYYYYDCHLNKWPCIGQTQFRL